MDRLLPFGQDEFGVKEYKGRPVVGSRDVARIFEKEHHNVLRDIDNIKEDMGKTGELKIEVSSFFQESKYKTNQGKLVREVLMTRDGFTLLAMGFTGPKAVRFKIAYINRFNRMEEALANLAEMRLDHPEFTEAIKAAHENPQSYHYSNEFDMVNRIVLGMRTRDFRRLMGIPDTEHSIRPWLTLEQAQLIKKLIRYDMGLLLTHPDYHERKRILTEYHDRLIQIKVLPV